MKDITTIFKEIEALVDLVCLDAPLLEDLQKDAEKFAILKAFNQDLEKLHTSIVALYKKNFGKTAGTYDLITTLTELIPEKHLSKIKTTLSALAITDWFENTPELHLESLAIAVEKRIQIMLDPEKNLNVIRRRLSLSEVQLSNPENEGSVQFRRSRRSLSQEITGIDQALEIANIIKSKYLKSREGRIRLQLAMLEKLMRDFPEKIRVYSFQNNTTAELLAVVRNSFTQIGQSSILVGREAFEKRSETTIKCEELIKIILSQLIESIHSYLSPLKSGLRQSTLEGLERQLAILPSLILNLAQPITDPQTYSELVDQFAGKYLSIFLDIYDKYHSLEEKILRGREVIAIQHIEAQVDSQVYPYKLKSNDLRLSENSYLNELRQAYHPDKIIIATLAEDNLLQIYKDYRRGLVINGLGSRRSEELKESETVTIEQDYLLKFRKLLQAEFGEMNTQSLIQHYSQNTAYLSSSPLVTSFNREAELLIMQPEALVQRIYEEEGMVYREIKVDSFRLLPLNSADPEDSEPWIFKCKILVQAWLSGEGFKVDAISTDCPLVALAYMKNSASDPLLSLIKIMTGIKADLDNKFNQLEETIDFGLLTFFDPEGHEQNTNRKQQIEDLRFKLKDFKEGKIGVEDLIKSLGNANEVTHKHSSAYSLLSLKLEQLIKWNDELIALALPYQNKLAIECTQIPMCKI